MDRWGCENILYGHSREKPWNNLKKGGGVCWCWKWQWCNKTENTLIGLLRGENGDGNFSFLRALNSLTMWLDLLVSWVSGVFPLKGTNTPIKWTG